MIDPKTNASFDGHEQVVFVGGESQGYAGIIAIHSTAIGPAAGSVGRAACSVLYRS